MDESALSNGTGFQQLFSGTPLPPIYDELRMNGGTATGESCDECGGMLYEYDYEVVCGVCSLVQGAPDRSESPSLWDWFAEDRPRYPNSNQRRCVGGFGQTYDWVKSEDIEGSVRAVEPEQFYG